MNWLSIAITDLIRTHMPRERKKGGSQETGKPAASGRKGCFHSSKGRKIKTKGEGTGRVGRNEWEGSGGSTGGAARARAINYTGGDANLGLSEDSR